MGKSARGAAIAILDAVLGDGVQMSDALVRPAVTRMEPADQARAKRLASDVLRGLERADRLLNRHLRKKPPLSVHNALRLGLIELVQGGAAHGVVHAIVGEVGRLPRQGALKGLVNAVLRKVATEVPEKWDVLRVPRLPKAFRAHLIEAWGSDAVAAMEVAHFNGAALDITPKPGAETVPDGTRLPTGSLRLTGTPQVSALPGFGDGNWWVQDAAAALPVRILNVQPGEAVLDMCAAPGGKTLQMAAAGAKVTAVDKSQSRMARVEENLARTDLEATLLVDDALKITGQFEAVLLDAPCSATGTIRRHPELPHVKTDLGIDDLIALQSAMMDHAWGLLKPGGRLVFCTCSLLPEEGEAQLTRALDTFDAVTLDTAALQQPGIDPAWITDEGGLRLRPDYWPEHGGMDGFFIAALRKAG